MAEDDDETGIRTLLGSLPPVDPAILKQMQDTRLQNSHFAMIGRVAAEWAFFEAIIDTYLHVFADVDNEVGVCFTGQMIGPRPRIDAFIALAKHLGADKKWDDVLEEFARDAQGLAEQRNRAVHDMWLMDDPALPRRLEATARRKVKLHEVPVPTADLISLMDNISKLNLRFSHEIAGKIFTELHTSPRTTE